MSPTTPRLKLEYRLGLLHGQIDAAAGYLAGVWLSVLSPDTAFSMILGYNLLAFALQIFWVKLPPPLYQHAIRLASVFSALALMLIVLLPPSLFWICVVLSGLAGSLFHVGAGALSLHSAQGSHRKLGWFLAPGVLGLLVGMVCGFEQLNSVAFGLALALWLSAAVWPIGLVYSPPENKQNENPQPVCWLFWGGIVLLLLIAGRSAVWLFYQGHSVSLTSSILLLFACAAFSGKFIGGMLADKLGAERVSIGGLLLACLWFYIAQLSSPVLFIAVGLACLQSGVPPLLMLLNQEFRNPALSAALGLGVMVIVSGLVVTAIVIYKPYWLVGLWMVPGFLGLAHSISHYARERRGRV